MTGNPTLSENTFTEVGRANREDAMTVQGAVNKTAILLALTTISAAYTWQMASKGHSSATVWMIGGALAGFVLALITTFKKTWSPVTAPLYALAEGLFIGAISCVFERQFPGVVS